MVRLDVLADQHITHANRMGRSNCVTW